MGEREGGGGGLFQFSLVDIRFSVTSDMFWHLTRLNTISVSLRLGLNFGLPRVSTST